MVQFGIKTGGSLHIVWETLLNTNLFSFVSKASVFAHQLLKHLGLYLSTPYS